MSPAPGHPDPLPDPDADAWDRRIAWDGRIARDAAAGRLDALAEEALADLREGRTCAR